MLFLSCHAVVVVPDPHLCRRDHPPSPQADRVGLGKLTADRQARPLLAYLRKGETFDGLGSRDDHQQRLRCSQGVVRGGMAAHDEFCCGEAVAGTPFRASSSPRRRPFL